MRRIALCALVALSGCVRYQYVTETSASAFAQGIPQRYPGDFYAAEDVAVTDGNLVPFAVVDRLMAKAAGDDVICGQIANRDWIDLRPDVSVFYDGWDRLDRVGVGGATRVNEQVTAAGRYPRGKPIRVVFYRYVPFQLPVRLDDRGMVRDVLTSEARDAGLLEGDMIDAVDGCRFPGSSPRAGDQWWEVLASLDPGRPVSLDVIRQGTGRITVTVSPIESLPLDLSAAPILRMANFIGHHSCRISVADFRAAARGWVTR